MLTDKLKNFLLICFVVTILKLVGGLVFAYYTEREYWFYFRDIAHILEAPFYIGFVSQYGNLLWAILLGITIYNYVLLSEFNVSHTKRNFYLFASFLILILTIDDIFLIHEDAAYTLLKIPQKFVYGTYILLFLIFILKFYRYILQTNYVIFLIALFLFGLSIVIDYLVVVFNLHENLILLEDGLKLFGIIVWIAYFAGTGRMELKAFLLHK